MAWDFKNPEELIEHRKDAQEAYRPTRGELERRVMLDIGDYGGMQWGRVDQGLRFDRSGGVSRLQTDYNPDSSGIRVTRNRVTVNTQKAAVATFPHAIEAEVFPPDRDSGIDAVARAQTYEDALGVMMDAANYREVRRDTNHQRSVWGSYGVGFWVRARKTALSLYGSKLELPDHEIRAFSFAPTDLTLDPDCRHRQLREHEYVVYSKVWTARKIREVLGVELDEEELATVGELSPFQDSLNRYTENQVYAQYRTFSKSKGAVVHQHHFRDESGRFSLMFIEIETPEGDPEVVNFDNPETPFGGSGLPLELFHGHRRTDGPWGISEPTMMRADQYGLNLAASHTHRMMARNAGFQVAMDSNSLDKKNTEERFRDSITNMVGGLLMYSSGTREKPGNAPQLIQYPQPQPVMLEIASQYEISMQEQVHRGQVTSGVLKTHVPDAVYQTALDQAGQVLGARVAEDVEVDNALLSVLLGTTIKLVKSMSPCTLGILEAKRFGPEALMMLYEADPVNLDAEIKVREGSVRFRSPDAKRKDLGEALKGQAITPGQFRMALVRDTDTPLTNDDKFFSRRSELAALSVLRGAEWKPVPLGQYSDWILDAFRRAIMDPLADEAAVDRLTRAIIAQTQMTSQEMAMAQPPQPQQSGQVDAGGGVGSIEPGGTVSIAELLASAGASG